MSEPRSYASFGEDDLIPDMIFDLRRDVDLEATTQDPPGELAGPGVEVDAPSTVTSPDDSAIEGAGGEAPVDAREHAATEIQITALKQVQSVGDLIELAFRKGTKPRVSQKLASALDAVAFDREDVVRRLDELFIVDPLLKGPIRALWLVENSTLSPRLRSRILDAIEICLLRHPLAPIWSVRSVIEAEELKVLGAVQALRTSLDSEGWTRRWPESGKPADRPAFARNLTAAATLIWALRSGAGLSAVSELLDVGVWSPAEVERSSFEATSTVVLAESSARGDLHLLYSALRSSMSFEQARAMEAVEALEAEVRARGTVELELESSRVIVGELEGRIAELTRQLGEAAKALQDEDEARRIALAHAANDFERLRAGTLTGVSKEVAMLKDALGALEDERVRVAMDYVSRAIEGLEGEVGTLRDAERLRGAGS